MSTLAPDPSNEESSRFAGAEAESVEPPAIRKWETGSGLAALV
jgi:hypothetical protein